MSPPWPILLLVAASVLTGCSVNQSATWSLPVCESPAGADTASASTLEGSAASEDGVVRDGGDAGSRVLYDPPPRLVSHSAAANAVERRYPENLRQAGIGGVVRVRALVGADGRVQNSKVWQSSGRLDLDRAALEAVGAFRFHPAVAGDCRAAVWTEVPVTFSAVD